MTDIDKPTSSNIEGKLSFFERQLNARMQSGNISTTLILGSVIVLLARALLVNAYEMQRFNNRKDNNE